MANENQKRSAWKAATRGDTLPPYQVRHLEPHHALADGRGVRAANGQSVVAEADGREDKAEQQPGKPKGEDTEHGDGDIRRAPSASTMMMASTMKAMTRLPITPSKSCGCVTGS